jgi:hypothetical protein
MNSGKSFAPIQETIMKKARQDAAYKSQTSFNYHKLQATACMATSAAVSIALIYWAIRSFF